MYEVDYKNDNYRINVSCGDLALSPYSISRSMAQYAFWLEHEYSRIKTSPLGRLQREGWYERRISWFVELMNVMQAPADKIAQRMMETTITETRSEKVNQGDIIDHFLASIRINGVKTSGGLTCSRGA
jgi:hypothetical protein